MKELKIESKFTVYDSLDDTSQEVQELMLRPLSDSRLELIADRDFLLTDFEEKLLATVQTT